MYEFILIDINVTPNIIGARHHGEVTVETNSDRLISRLFADENAW